MIDRTLMAAVLCAGIAGAIPLVSSQADDPGAVNDPTSLLPDQPVSDEELKKESSTPPQGTAIVDAGGNFVDATIPSLTSLPELQGDSGTTRLDAGVGTAAMSDLSANVSNNDFHN